MPDDGHPFIPTLPRAFPQENPPDEAFRTSEYKAYLSFKDWAPARWLARTEDERRELVTERLRARAERWADAHEDFRRYWDCYGEVPHRARVYVPYPAVSDEWWPDLHPIVAVADQTPPWRNESFRQWRDRALADFVRPDLSREERLAYFRERFDRVPDILSIYPTRGRGYLFIPQRARSTAPAMEAELLEDRRDAGDELVSPAASRGTFVLPAVNVRRNYAFGTLTWGGQVPGNIRARRTVAATPEERRRIVLHGRRRGRGKKREVWRPLPTKLAGAFRPAGTGSRRSVTASGDRPTGSGWSVSAPGLPKRHGGRRRPTMRAPATVGDKTPASSTQAA